MQPSTLRTTPVAAVMHAGVITCRPDAPLEQVASMMAEHRIHCVVVRERDDDLPAVISDLDVVGAARDGGFERPAREIAGSPSVAVSSRETADRAAQLMHEYGTSHLLVVDPESGSPVGVVSTLDVAELIADVKVDAYEGLGRARASLPPGLRP